MAKRTKTDGMVKILAVYNSEDADEVDMRLRMEHIPCVRQKIGAGKYGNFLLAMNNFGEEIYVSPEQEAEAGNVIEQWRADRKKEREESGKDEIPADESGTGKMLAARIFAGVVVVILVALYIIKR